MNDRVTKHGVRDLNPRGYNGRSARGTRDGMCSHAVVTTTTIGYRLDEDGFEEPVYGGVCAQFRKVFP